MYESYLLSAWKSNKYKRIIPENVPFGATIIIGTSSSNSKIISDLFFIFVL